MGKSKGKCDDTRAGKGGLRQRFQRLHRRLSLLPGLGRWPLPLSRSARAKAKAAAKEEIDQDLIDTLDD